MVNYAAIVLVVSVVVVQAEDTESTQDIDTKIQELQRQRVAALGRAVEIASLQYREGAVDFLRVFALQQALADALLETTDSVERQIRFCESSLQILTGGLRIAEEQYQGGRVSELDVLTAKSVAQRIEVELWKRRRGQTAANTAVTERITTKVQDLQRVQVATLDRAVEIVELQYREGAVDLSRVTALQLACWEANLDAANTSEQQIRVCESRLDVARGVVNIAECSFEAAHVSELDVLTAKSVAQRIEVELWKRRRGQTAANTAVTERITTKVQDLQRVQVATLDRAVEIVELQYREGAIDFPRVAAIQLACWEAKLDDADTVEHQLHACESQLVIARGVVNFAEGQFQDGRVSEVDICGAMAVALRIEVELWKRRRALAEESSANDRQVVQAVPDAGLCQEWRVFPTQPIQSGSWHQKCFGKRGRHPGTHGRRRMGFGRLR